jgi:hypothetical protein
MQISLLSQAHAQHQTIQVLRPATLQLGRQPEP